MKDNRQNKAYGTLTIDVENVTKSSTERLALLETDYKYNEIRCCVPYVPVYTHYHKFVGYLKVNNVEFDWYGFLSKDE